MVKAAVDVSPIVDAYVQKLKQVFDVDRVILSDIRTDGVDGEAVEVRFVVVSRVFDGMDHFKRSEELGRVGLAVSSLILAWPYSPEEFDGFWRGGFYDGLLAQLLSGSREVYAKPDLTPLPKLRKAARRTA